MRKSLVSLLLLVVLSITLIGCVDIGPDPDPDADPVTLTVYRQLANYSG